MQLSEAIKVVDELAKSWMSGAPHQQHIGRAVQCVADAATIAMANLGDADAESLRSTAVDARHQIHAEAQPAQAETPASDDDGPADDGRPPEPTAEPTPVPTDNGEEPQAGA